MIDVGVGEGGQALCDEIHGCLEGRLFGDAIVAPEESEGGLGRFQKGEPEEIFQSAVKQRIALHIEEQIPGARTR